MRIYIILYLWYMPIIIILVARRCRSTAAAARCSMQRYSAAQCSIRQHTAGLHCSTLQHTAANCNTLQHNKKTATNCFTIIVPRTSTHELQHPAAHCSATTYYNATQNPAAHCSTLQHTATHCNALQRTATHCNALEIDDFGLRTGRHTTSCMSSTHCITLQHTATYYRP